MTIDKKFVSRYFLQILLSTVFVVSGWLKLAPIEPFELTLVDSGIVPWSLAPYAARLLIALEVFIGLALLFNTKHTRLVLKCGLYLTLFFCVYLLLLWWFRGNDINCGCFGTQFSMTPIESLLKNALIIIAIMGALRLSVPTKRNLKWVYLFGGLVLIVMPFILNPPDGYFSSVDETKYPYELRTELIPDTIKTHIPFNIEKGEYLIAFLSITCPHCKVGAQKLSVADKKHELPRIHAFFIGDEGKMSEFRFESNSNLPYTMFRDQSFFKFTKGLLPTFLLIKDGQVLKRWSGSEFSYDEISRISSYIEE